MQKFVSVAAIISILFVSCACVVDEKRLHSDLLAGYNANVRPILNQSGTVNVDFGLALVDFELDSNTDILDSSFWLRMKWTDEYLRWEPSEYGDLSITRFSPSDIWKPDLFLYNSWDAVSIQEVSSMGSYPLVSSKGSVLWVPAARLRSRCTIDRTYWPREVAHCYLKFGSWTHHGFGLNISLYNNNADLDMSEFIGSQRWLPLNTSAQLVNKIYSCCDEPYPSIEFNITLQRHEHRTAEVTLPLLVSVWLMVASFIVPIDHGQKLTLGCVSVITALVGMLHVYSKMTEEAHGQAAIALFYTSYIVILLLFYTMQVCLVRLARVSSWVMPALLRNLFSGILARCLCLDAPLFHNYSQEDNEMLDQPHGEDGEFASEHTPHSGSKPRRRLASAASAEWHLMATALDRVTAVAFLVLMLVIVPPNITW